MISTVWTRKYPSLRERMALMARHAAARSSNLARPLIGAVLVAGAALAVPQVATAAPHIRDCGTTTTDSTQGGNGWTDNTTTSQTPACDSASDTNQTTDTVVLNNGGNAPGGHN